jgi:hypothetical protein
MTKFIRKIMLFSLPIIFFVILGEYSLRKVPNDYSYKNNYFIKNAENIELLVLGSSHSFFGINPEFFTQGSSFNAAHVSQSLNYDYFIFNKFKDNLVNLKMLLLPLSYFTLFSQLEDGVEDWRVKNYSIYYDSDYHNSLKYNTEIVTAKPISILKAILKQVAPYESNNTTISALGFGLGYSNIKQSDLLATGISAAKRHTKDNFNRLKENLQIINKLIVESNEKNIRVFLFTTPARKSYIENLNTNQLSIMQTSISEIVKNHPNVEYHSFLKDKRFVNADFKDADHLNGIGAKKLTKIIDALL